MSLAEQILRRSGTSPLVRYGFIEAIEGGLASVRIGATVIDNATWCAGYLPVVGDRVAILADATGWLVLDKVERVPRLYNEPETVLVEPAAIGTTSKRTWSESWEDSTLTPEVDPKPPSPVTDIDWSGVYSYVPDPSAYLWQDMGIIYTQAGDGALVNYRPSHGPGAALFWYPRLDEQVPSGATITSVSLIVRTPGRTEALSDFAQPPSAAPVKFHVLKDGVLDDGAGAGQPPDFFADPAFEPIDLGTMAPESLVKVLLPDDLALAMTTGTRTGLLGWPGDTNVRTILSDWLEWRYEYRDYGGGHWSWTPYARTLDCMSLQVTYMTLVDDT